MIEAVIMGGAGITVAVVGLAGVLYGHLNGRINELDDDLKAARSYNQRLWAYCRRLMDLYYRNRRDGAPDPEPLPDDTE
ncbi:MAG: hypothetical protein QM753_06760 [Thermomicrobiales bacterium]